MELRFLEFICCPACNSDLELITEKAAETDIIQGELKCRNCNKCFSIDQGLPNLLFPETMKESDQEAQRFYDRRAPLYDIRNRLALLRMGAWEYALMQERVMRSLINKLEIKSGDSVLETGVGTGNALPIISRQLGREGRLHASDISYGMLKIAQRRIQSKKIHTGLVLANASYLPYKADVFDAVFHMGGWNTFADKPRAMSEMCRVAKSGARILFGDEGLGPGKEKTLIGKWILRRDKSGSYLMQPPAELVPDNVEDLKIYWDSHGLGWFVEFKNIK